MGPSCKLSRSTAPLAQCHTMTPSTRFLRANSSYNQHRHPVSERRARQEMSPNGVLGMHHLLFPRWREHSGGNSATSAADSRPIDPTAALICIVLASAAAMGSVRLDGLQGAVRSVGDSAGGPSEGSPAAGARFTLWRRQPVAGGGASRRRPAVLPVDGRDDHGARLEVGRTRWRNPALRERPRSVELPPRITRGTYYYGACVDAVSG